MQGFRIRPLALAIATIGGPLGLSLTAAAQAQTLSDVVVSASRSEQRSFDAPAAVQGVSRQTIEEAGMQVNLSESVNRIPGVVALNRQNYAQDLQLSVRGFGARSTFGIRGVRVIVDGIPATMPDGQGQASSINLGSTERIEVLRGPLAQLYGNAAGGVVQIFTRDGVDPDSVGATLSAGSYGQRRYDLLGQGRSGSVSWVANYSDFSTDGYRDHSATVRKQFNTKWRFDLTDSTRLTLVANSLDQPKSLDPLGLTRAQMEANPRQAVQAAYDQDTMKRVSQNQVGAVLDHKFDAANSLTARVYTGDRDLYSKLSVPLSAQTAATSAGGIVTLDRTFGGVGVQYRNQTRVGEGVVTTVVGADYDDMKDRRKGYINNLGVQGALKRDEDNLVNNTDLYAQSTWDINPDWSVTGGVRSTAVKFRVKDYFITGAANGDDSGANTYRATNPVVGVTRHFGDALNVYANWGRGFESPTFTELAYRAGASGLNFGLQASRSRHLEVGAKALISPDHRLDVALFTVGTDNEIAVDANNGGRTFYRNGGRTERTGLELSYAGRWAETVTAYLALSVMDATFKDGFTPTTGTAVAAGNAIPGVPNRLAFGEIAWRPKLDGALSGFSTAVEVVHSGRLYVNDTNTDAASSYTVFNLRAGLMQKIGNWRLREFVRLDNVADKKYAGSVVVNDTNGRFFEPAPGRNWVAGVNVTYEFR